MAAVNATPSASLAARPKKKKKDKAAPPKKPRIVVEYKGVIDEDRVERISGVMDGLLEQFTGLSEKLQTSTSLIKRRKFESDILQTIEKMRDLMWDTVRGDKRELDCVFGGNCIRIGKVLYQMDRSEGGDGSGSASCSSPGDGGGGGAASSAPHRNSSSKLSVAGDGGGSASASSSTADGASSSASSTAGDSVGANYAGLIAEPRWKDLRQAAESVKAVLMSMGHFRQWRPDEEEEEESETDEDELTAEERHERWIKKLTKILNGPQSEKQVLTDWTKIDQVTTLEECLNLKVDAKYQFSNFMLWMVHRIHLNDPLLSELSFAGVQMPLPDDEPRCAPKLVKAIHTNTWLDTLHLQNSTLQSGEAEVLAQGLKLNKNTKLRELNIEGNFVDVNALCSIADALSVNNTIEVLRISGQQGEALSNRGMGQKFEETIGQAMLKNQSLITVGVAMYNATWRDVVDRGLTRNNDRKKRMERRKLGLPSTMSGTASVIIPDEPTSSRPSSSRDSTTAKPKPAPSRDTEIVLQQDHLDDGKNRGPSVSAFRDRIEGRTTAAPSSTSLPRRTSATSEQMTGSSPHKSDPSRPNSAAVAIEKGAEAADVDADGRAEDPVPVDARAAPQDEDVEDEDEIEIVNPEPPPQQSISWLVTDENGEGRIASATLPIVPADGEAAEEEAETTENEVEDAAPAG